MTGGPVLEDIGVGAIVAEYPGRTDEDANRLAVALSRSLPIFPAGSVLDAIPGARTLLVLFDPAQLSHDAARSLFAARAAVPPPPNSGGRDVSIPAAYGDELGPDLAELASIAGMASAEAARRHASGDYRVAFMGFAPGFAYLSGLEAALQAPRLSTPRPRVPSGSVAIGGPYTGIYPSETPGGWRLIGRSAVRLFDEESDPPALLSPGDRIRFERVGAPTLALLERESEAAASRTRTSPGGRPVFRVVKPGVFTSVQGSPRWGRGAAGLPAGGAMVESALAEGNARLGNAFGAPAIEMSLLGPELEALSPVGITLSGAPVAAERNGAPFPAGSALRLSPGDRVRFGPTRGAVRTYLCVEGGLLAPGRLGLTRRLEAGAILMAAPGAILRSAGEPGVAVAASPGEVAGKELRLRLLLDPRRDRFFEAGAVEEFLASTYRISATSDRRGIRLEGPPLIARGAHDMPPEGTPLGAIQVPADGQPIVLGPDRPITGGYARIGTIIAADWPLLAQAPPGRSVRLSRVGLGEALGSRVVSEP